MTLTQTRSTEFYRLSFRKPPNELNLVFRYSITSEPGRYIVLKRIGSVEREKKLFVTPDHTIEKVKKEFAEKYNLHKRGIQILTLDGRVLHDHERLKSHGLVQTPYEIIDNFIRGTAALFFAIAVLILTAIFQTISYAMQKMLGKQQRPFMVKIVQIPFTKYRLAWKKTRMTVPRYFYRYRNIFDLMLWFFIIATFLIEYVFETEIKQLRTDLQNSFEQGKLGDNQDISIYFKLKSYKLESNEVVFGFAVFICVLRTIPYLEVFPNIIKTLQLMYLMISKLGVYLLFFLLFVVGFSILFFVFFWPRSKLFVYIVGDHF